MSEWRTHDGVLNGYDIHAAMPHSSFGKRFNNLEEAAKEILFYVSKSKVPIPEYDILQDNGPQPLRRNRSGTFCEYSQVPDEAIGQILLSLLQDSTMIKNARMQAVRQYSPTEFQQNI